MHYDQVRRLVAKGERPKRFVVKQSMSSVQMSVCDVQKAEAILARLVARAYAADHPELFPHLARTIGGSADEK